MPARAKSSGSSGAKSREPSIVAVTAGSNRVAAVARQQLCEGLSVDARRIEHLDVAAAPLLPVGDEIHEQQRSPRDAAFEEREIQPREPAGDTTHHQRFRDRFAGGGDGTDVVVHVEARDARSLTERARRGRSRRRRDRCIVATRRRSRVAPSRPMSTGRPSPRTVPDNITQRMPNTPTA